MKLRWLLVVPILMAVFAVAPLGASAAPSVVTDLKAGIVSDNSDYPFIHGVTEYKLRAGGGSSFAVSIQGAQALRGQQLTIYLLDANDNYGPVCTLHIGVNGNGSCYLDTRTGAIVPPVAQGFSYIDVYTTLSDTYLAYADF